MTKTKRVPAKRQMWGGLDGIERRVAILGRNTSASQFHAKVNSTQPQTPPQPPSVPGVPTCRVREPWQRLGHQGSTGCLLPHANAITPLRRRHNHRPTGLRHHARQLLLLLPLPPARRRYRRYRLRLRLRVHGPGTWGPRGRGRCRKREGGVGSRGHRRRGCTTCQS